MQNTSQATAHQSLHLPRELFTSKRHQVAASVLTLLALGIQLNLFLSLNTLAEAAVL